MMAIPIPSPPSIPFLGNISALERDVPLRSMVLLSRQFGEIYALHFGQRQVIFVNTVALANELCDEKRFHKVVQGGLKEVRNGARDGLFTAYHGEPNWAIAHRILIPAFGPAAIRDMFDDMMDICNQLLLKWERFGPDNLIDPTEDYTRLTFDTIALCTANHRFNSFYMEDTQPFVLAMSRFLTESGNRANRPQIISGLYAKTNAQYEADLKTMDDVATELLEKRRARPLDKKDLLNLMIYGKDAQTGLGLPDENIKGQLLTFLIAGHETSSGLASFATYYLLKNPATYARAKAEVDSVLGDQPMRREHLTKLPYLQGVLRETLRLSPSAPAFTVCSDEDTVLAHGKYALPAKVAAVVLAYQIHRDPTVWGPDAEEFKPERMMPGEFEKIPKNAWKPFGNGMRACIGRGFALQEILIVLASIIQKFDLRLADPKYTLELQQSLTIKPKGLRIYASPRSDGPGKQSTGVSSTVAANKSPQKGPVTTKSSNGTGGKPLYAAYGGNTGSCEGFAQKLAEISAAQGFNAQVFPLDSIANCLPTDGPLIIFTASFEGQPADNAGHFLEYLKSLDGNNKTLENVKFTVFGCGNTEWASTYQAIPRLVDELMANAGAQRLVPRAEADAGGDSFFETFDNWEENLWPVISKTYGVSGDHQASREEDFVIHVTQTVRAARLRQADAGLGKVIENRLLTKNGAPAKIHIEFQLPEGTTYRAGDYLAILPNNPPESVRRCLAHFGLLPEQQITITSGGPTTLPVDSPISLWDLLSGYVELAQVASKRNIHSLIETTKDEPTRLALDSLASIQYKDDVLEKKLSVLDLLELYPKVELSLSAFIRMLPPMRVRQYSISSSPLWNAEHATLTVGVVEAPALAGDGKQFFGVASNYLAHLKPGDLVTLAIRPGTAAFHLPEPEVPIVMFCAGAGFAPMRGFIQERAIQLAAGRGVGRTLLFMGCRNPEADYLYADGDLKEWREMGAVEVRPAFSRSSEHSEGCKYVQDRVLHDKQDIIDLFAAGAKFYTCGTIGVSKGISHAGHQIIKHSRGVDDEEAARLLEKVFKERYATDVFG